MTWQQKYRVSIAVVALSCSACGGDDEPQSRADAAIVSCAVPAGSGVAFDADAELCDKLSSYRFFVGDMVDQVPNDRVVPYDVTTALYADYTYKYRFLWLPEGTAMAYRARDAFAFPTGSVLIKTFAYPRDMRNPERGQTLLETRLLYLTSSGWAVATYVWNQDQTEAIRKVAGDRIPSQWIHTDGTDRQINYSVPNENQCKNCHEESDDEIAPLGPKARYLNSDFAYASGTENQLKHLAQSGYLTGLPADPAQVPRAPVWNDPATGSLDERARTWLDINCAHCHNPRGAARTSGLDLSFDQSNLYELGHCKPPVAAGGGSGGRQYNIVPGKPGDSILIYRLESDEPDERMPEVGRQLEDEDGVALIREWITAMPTGSCTGGAAARP
ncbi:MAG: hypothetical protein MJE77_02960 [Proteobacteria bacterium]|nr:hypothetical protein [Pseudomonadota bacterium]